MCARTFDLFFMHGAEDFVLEPEMGRRARAWLADRYGEPAYVAEGWVSFGFPFESTVDLLWDEEDECQLLVRIDIDAEAYAFIVDLCNLARSMQCTLYSPEFERSFMALPSVVIAQLMRCEAWSETWGQLEQVREIEERPLIPGYAHGVDVGVVREETCGSAGATAAPPTRLSTEMPVDSALVSPTMRLGLLGNVSRLTAAALRPLHLIVDSRQTTRLGGGAAPR